MSLRHRTIASAALLVVLGVVGPLVVSAHFGALRVPRSDDWSYLRTLFNVTRHGRWDFNGWGSMTLIGQIVLAAPVALLAPGSLVAARVLTACVGGVGLVAVLALGRRLGVSRSVTLLVAVLTATSPLWGALATTFMTDVWLFTFQALALAALARALRGVRLDRVAFALAAAAGFAGVAIRQYGMVTLVAVFVFAGLHALHDDRGARRFIGVVGAVTLVALVALFLAWARIPNRLVLSLSLPSARSLHQLLQDSGGFVRLAGLLALPVLVLVGPAAIVRRARATAGDLAVLVGVAAAGFLGFSYLIGTNAPFVGNYFDRRGVLSDDIIFGNRPLVMPTALFEVLVLAGSIGGVLLVLLALPEALDGWTRVRARSWSSFDPLVGAVTFVVVGTYATYCCTTVSGLPIFDRYALPALPLVGLLSGRAVGGRTAASPVAVRRARSSAAVVTVALAGIGFVYAAESASFDATRWRVAEAATRHGFEIRDVYEGYEWIGWHRGIAPPYLLADTDAVRLRKRKRYFAGSCVSVVVIDSPRRPSGAIATLRTTGLLRDDAWVAAKAIPGARCASGARNPAGSGT